MAPRIKLIVDDTYVLIHEYDVEGFTSHINSIDESTTSSLPSNLKQTANCPSWTCVHTS